MSLALALAITPHTTKPNARTSKIVGSEAPQTAQIRKIELIEAKIANKVENASKALENTSEAKMFIYMKESGNRVEAINASSGACGIGQALPCSKLKNICPNMDYACQDQFFTKYMQNRYGTWENAKAFWIANKWW